MRHRVAHRKLGRTTEHRIAMLRNQASALIQHERIQTTVARGKELRPFVERLITIAKRSLSAKDGTHGVNARRMVSRDIADREVVTKLFDTIAPRYVDRPGGYTRLLRLGNRRGDNAEVAEVELLGSEFDPAKLAKTDKAGEGTPEGPKKRSIADRLRALGGGRKKADDTGGGRVEKRAKGVPKKSTTPRKAGGS